MGSWLPRHSRVMESSLSSEGTPLGFHVFKKMRSKIGPSMCTTQDRPLEISGPSLISRYCFNDNERNLQGTSNRTSIFDLPKEAVVGASKYVSNKRKFVRITFSEPLASHIESTEDALSVESFLRDDSHYYSLLNSFEENVSSPSHSNYHNISCSQTYMSVDKPCKTIPYQFSDRIIPKNGCNYTECFSEAVTPTFATNIAPSTTKLSFRDSTFLMFMAQKTKNLTRTLYRVLSRHLKAHANAEASTHGISSKNYGHPTGHQYENLASEKCKRTKYIDDITRFSSSSSSCMSLRDGDAMTTTLMTTMRTKTMSTMPTRTTFEILEKQGHNEYPEGQQSESVFAMLHRLSSIFVEELEQCSPTSSNIEFTDGAVQSSADLNHSSSMKRTLIVDGLPILRCVSTDTKASLDSQKVKYLDLELSDSDISDMESHLRKNLNTKSAETLTTIAALSDLPFANCPTPDLWGDIALCAGESVAAPRNEPFDDTDLVLAGLEFAHPDVVQPDPYVVQPDPAVQLKVANDNSEIKIRSEESKRSWEVHDLVDSSSRSTAESHGSKAMSGRKYDSPKILSTTSNFQSDSDHQISSDEVATLTSQDPDLTILDPASSDFPLVLSAESTDPESWVGSPVLNLISKLADTSEAHSENLGPWAKFINESEVELAKEEERAIGLSNYSALSTASFDLDLNFPQNSSGLVVSPVMQLILREEKARAKQGPAKPVLSVAVDCLISSSRSQSIVLGLESSSYEEESDESNAFQNSIHESEPFAAEIWSSNNSINSLEESENQATKIQKLTSKDTSHETHSKVVSLESFEGAERADGFKAGTLETMPFEINHNDTQSENTNELMADRQLNDSRITNLQPRSQFMFLMNLRSDVLRMQNIIRFAEKFPDAPLGAYLKNLHASFKIFGSGQKEFRVISKTFEELSFLFSHSVSQLIPVCHKISSEALRSAIDARLVLDNIKHLRHEVGLIAENAQILGDSDLFLLQTEIKRLQLCLFEIQNKFDVHFGDETDESRSQISNIQNVIMQIREVQSVFLTVCLYTSCRTSEKPLPHPKDEKSKVMEIYTFIKDRFLCMFRIFSLKLGRVENLLTRARDYISSDATSYRTIFQKCSQDLNVLKQSIETMKLDITVQPDCFVSETAPPKSPFSFDKEISDSSPPSDRLQKRAEETKKARRGKKEKIRKKGKRGRKVKRASKRKSTGTTWN